MPFHFNFFRNKNDTNTVDKIYPIQHTCGGKKSDGSALKEILEVWKWFSKYIWIHSAKKNWNFLKLNFKSLESKHFRFSWIEFICCSDWCFTLVKQIPNIFIFPYEKQVLPQGAHCGNHIVYPLCKHVRRVIQLPI